MYIQLRFVSISEAYDMYNIKELQSIFLWNINKILKIKGRGTKEDAYGIYHVN